MLFSSSQRESTCQQRCGPQNIDCLTKVWLKAQSPHNTPSLHEIYNNLAFSQSTSRHSSIKTQTRVHSLRLFWLTPLYMFDLFELKKLIWVFLYAILIVLSDNFMMTDDTFKTTANYLGFTGQLNCVRKSVSLLIKQLTGIIYVLNPIWKTYVFVVKQISWLFQMQYLWGETLCLYRYIQSMVCTPEIFKAAACVTSPGWVWPNGNPEVFLPCLFIYSLEGKNLPNYSWLCLHLNADNHDTKMFSSRSVWLQTPSGDSLLLTGGKYRLNFSTC